MFLKNSLIKMIFFRSLKPVTAPIMIVLASLLPLAAYAATIKDNATTDERFGAIIADKNLIKSILVLEMNKAIPKLDYSVNLSGVDANGDGVRDDLAIFADEKFNDLNQNSAVKQFYKHTNRVFTLNDSDQDTLKNYAVDLDRSKLCIEKHFGKDAAASTYKALVLYWGNTKERQEYVSNFLTKHNKESYGDIPKLEPHFSGCEWEDEITRKKLKKN